MRLSLIVGMAKNRAIGLDGAMPWHISEDLKYFKRVTLGAPILMGRKTFDSIGRPLPGRANIIVTRDTRYRHDGVIVVHELEAGITKAKALAEIDDKDEIFVIGGAQIYELALPMADRLYITEIHRTLDGDTWFPEFDATDWVELTRDDQEPETPEGPAFSFVVLDRKA